MASIESMEKVLTMYKEREVVLLQREQKAKEFVDQADLEKEQALLRESTLYEEIQRLTKKLEKV